MIRDSFKESLKNERLAHQLTQKELGPLIGVEGRTIGHYEQGGREPDLETLSKLGEIFNRDIIMNQG